MTAEEHNKALAICHLAYGGISTLMMFAMFGFMWFMLRALPPGGGHGGDFPGGLFLLMFGFIMVWSFIFTLPSFIAGYAMLKRKDWARTASIVAAVLEAMSVPIGTAVCVYSFWFMFSEGGRAMYDKSDARARGARPYSLHDAPPAPAADWNARTYQEREQAYAPPAQPPDWRG